MSKLCIISLLAATSVLLFAQSVRSATPPESTSKDSNPYILQDFAKDEFLHQLKNGRKKYKNCWISPKSYKVCVRRTPTQEYFIWNNEKIPFKVTTTKYKNGNYTQTWLFENGRFYLGRRPDGKVIQTLELPNTIWNYIISANGEVNEEWEGEKDEEALQHYKSEINSWCAVNDFYMGKEKCVIY